MSWASPVIHTDDTPIAVLAPGHGRTGRIWTYVVEERPWQGERAPATSYRFSPDRRGERPREHLASFHGVIQADAFSGCGAGPASGSPRREHAAHHARRMLGSRTAEILRWIRADQIADCRGGAAAHRRAVRFLFLGSEAGGERAAVIYTVLESAKLNRLDPEAYLADVIDRMAKGHSISRLSELLPWNWRRQDAKLAA
jgi:hypothetical protein